MFPSSKAVLSTAKASIKGNWAVSIAASSLVVAVFIVEILLTQLINIIFSGGYINDTIFYFSKSIGNILEVAAAALELLFAVPLLFGVLRFFWRITSGTKDSFGSVFRFFSDAKAYFSVLKLTLSLFFRVFLAILVLSILPAFLFALTNMDIVYLNSVAVEIIYVIIALISLAEFIVFFIYFSKFIPAPFILFENPDMKIGDVLKNSQKIMKGRRDSAIFLLLSLMGWILLSLFMFPLIFTMPILVCSVCVFTRYAIFHYKLGGGCITF